MMKTLILALLLFLSFDVSAIDVNRYLSGSWSNPSQNGHGLSIEVISDDVSVIYWYVYHPDGSPTFIIAVGKNKGGVIEADAYYNSGMRFGSFNPADNQEIPWGTIKVTFQSCTSATLQYASSLSYEGVPYGSGTIPITRLLSIDKMQCASSPNAGLYQGTFYSNKTQKTTTGFAIIAPNNDFAIVNYGNLAGLGSITFAGSSFSGAGKAVSAAPLASFNIDLTVSGSIDPDYRLTGGFLVKGVDDGNIDLYSVPGLYRRTLSMDKIAGKYNTWNMVTEVIGSVTLSAAGKFTGTDEKSCIYDGTLTLPDTQFNQLKVSIKITNCGTANGTYNGYGAQVDFYTMGDGRILRLLTSNGTTSVLMDLYR